MWDPYSGGFSYVERESDKARGIRADKDELYESLRRARARWEWERLRDRQLQARHERRLANRLQHTPPDPSARPPPHDPGAPASTNPGVVFHPIRPPDQVPILSGPPRRTLNPKLGTLLTLSMLGLASFLSANPPTIQPRAQEDLSEATELFEDPRFSKV